MKEINKINTFRKHINFMKEIYSQAFKQIKEYPANFFSVFYFDIILTLVYLLFYNIFQDISKEFLSWSYYDFILFYVSISLITKATYWFRLRYFNLKLLNGDLNIWISKPINPFLALSLRDKDSAIYTTFIFIPILLILLFFGEYSNYLFSFLILFFGLIYYVFFISFFQSFAFFIKDISFIVSVSNQLHYLNEQFTPRVFRDSILWFLYLLPNALIGYFYIEILKNNFLEFYYYFFGILFTFLFFYTWNIFTLALRIKKIRGLWIKK